jgi:hypothetical protein
MQYPGDPDVEITMSEMMMYAAVPVIDKPLTAPTVDPPYREPNGDGTGSAAP